MVDGDAGRFRAGISAETRTRSALGGLAPPPKRFLDEIVAKGSVAVDAVSLTVAEVLTDRFSVASSR